MPNAGLLASVALAGSVFLTGTPARAEAVTVSLVRGGKPNATIITAERPTPAARLSALELRYHVEKITGAVLPIKTDSRKTSGVRVLVGESKATRKLGLESAEFRSQEYLIRFAPQTIVLIGRDWSDSKENRAESGCGTAYRTLQDWRQTVDYVKATGRARPSGSKKTTIVLPGLFDDQGTCYATYDFLERFCGVRWYGPTALNIVFPKRTALAVQGRQVRRSPAMSYREGIGGGWPIVKAQWNNPNPDQLNLYWRRLRVGGERWAGNHSFRSYYDRFLAKNADRPELFEGERPDYFAKGWTKGERQFCYTNPALIEQVVRDARDYFDGKGLRGMQTAMGDYFAIVPMDNASWCKCERCQAVLARDKTNRRGAHFNSGRASQYLFGFVNAVAAKVRETHPKKYISALAYHVYAYRPAGIKLESNIAVAPCLQPRNYWAPRIKKNEMAFYRKWVDARDRPIYLWNYYCFPMEPAVIQGWHCFPGFSAHRLAGLIKMYHKDGVRGVFLCGIGEQVDYYLTMKLYDDPTIDPDKLLNEFFSRYFGAASEPMERFYLRIEEIYCSPDSYPSEVRRLDKQFHQTEETAWKHLGTRERMAELGGLMKNARSLARTDIEKQRVALWDKGVWQYMVAGRKKYLAKQ